MSLIGWVLGILAACALLLVMAYSARRSRPSVRKLGATRKYLQLHLWAGTAFLLLFLAHTSFGLPSGLLAILLWSTSVWVVITGAVGVALQKLVPRVLEPSASFEAHLQRVPAFVGELRTRAEGIAASADPRLKSWYEQRVAVDFVQPRMIVSLLRNPRAVRRGTGEVDILRRTLTAENVAHLESIRELQATKHELDVHYTMQRILRGWLWLHLPVAIALLGLVVLHVFFVMYF